MPHFTTRWLAGLTAIAALSACDSAFGSLIVNRCDVEIDVAISTDRFSADLLEIGVGRAERGTLTPDSGDLALSVRAQRDDTTDSDSGWHVEARPVDPRSGYIQASRTGGSFWIFIVEDDDCPLPSD